MKSFWVTICHLVQLSSTTLLAAEPKKDSQWKDWTQSIEEAKSRASKEQKLLVIYYRDHHCPPSIRDHDEMFARADFKEFAKSNLILLLLDPTIETKAPSKTSNSRSSSSKKKQRDVDPSYRKEAEHELLGGGMPSNSFAVLRKADGERLFRYPGSGNDWFSPYQTTALFIEWVEKAKRMSEAAQKSSSSPSK